MTTTTYYDLNIVEGTDIVNPLTVDNPNYNKIDEVMHDNAVAGVTLATEIANATIHAITRENSDCAVIRFIATSNWKAGDTVTVDGVPVTALLPSGETLPDGAYVINANVLCILTGTNLTVYAERKKTDRASDIAYNGTNVSIELDKINRDLTPTDISADFTLRNINSFKAIKLGRMIIFSFSCLDAQNSFSITTVKHKAIMDSDYLYLNYSAWANKDYQCTVQGLVKTDGTILDVKVSDKFPYTYASGKNIIYFV